VAERNNRMTVQLTGQAPLAVREMARDRFGVVGVPAEVSFERDAAGKVIAIVLHQNGAEQRGVRGELPPPPKEIALSPEALKEYVGRYPLAPTFVLTITEEGGALFAQATGQGRLPVFATARDEFFYKVVDARLSFQRDAAGKVSGVTLHQGGRELPARKTE
jgi:serine-type D-Ala-D-Ala carboxypeptidase/endopeptidase